MDETDARHERDDGHEDRPDDAVDEYENDRTETRESLEREAGLTALGGPSFGHLFDQAPPGDDGFDAEHNP